MLCGPYENQVMRTLTLLLTILTASLSQAALIERDWLAPGDALLTYDPNTGLEWLDVSQTILSRFSTSRITDEAADDAILQLQPGGALEGFNLASRADVEQLAVSAGVDVSSLQRAEQTADAMRTLIGMLRGRDVPLDSGGSVQGVIDEQVIPQSTIENRNVAGILAVSRPSTNRPRGMAGVGFANRTDQYRTGGGTVDSTGLLVFRIPEPSSGIALLVALACMRAGKRSSTLSKVLS